LLILSSTVTAIAFAIHAAIANTSSTHLSRSTVLVEQAFFVVGELLLIAGSILYTRKFLARATFVHWPRTFLFFSIAVLVVAFILDCVAFSNAPEPANSFYPSTRYTQLRIAASALVFILVTVNAVFLLLGKIVAPELPGLEFALVVISACFLWVPAFCELSFLLA
jgi:hypothetical protein